MFFSWRVIAWGVGASDQFLRRLAMQLTENFTKDERSGAYVWNCLGWRELGHFCTLMMLWPPFLQSKLYSMQCMLLCQCMNEWCAQGLIWAHKRRRSCVAMVRIHRIFKICNAVCTRCWVALLMSLWLWTIKKLLSLMWERPYSRNFSTCPMSAVFLPLSLQWLLYKGLSL